MARLTTLDKQRQLRASLRGSVGTFMGIPGSLPYELASLAGFDWVVSDLEHGDNDFFQLSISVKAFEGPVIARVPSLAASDISRSLDRAVCGIMLPRISDSKSLEDALAATRYPPRGTRGVASYNRAAGWGEDPQYLLESNPVVLVQVETNWAVQNCREIIENELVDGIFVGPLDLSFALGVPRQFSADVFQTALLQVVEACKEAGKPVGILATTSDQINHYRTQGFDFTAIGSDSTMLLGAFKESIRQARGTDHE